MHYTELQFPKDALFLVTGGAGFIGSNLCEAMQWTAQIILACFGLLFKENLPWCLNIAFVALPFFMQEITAELNC